MRLLYLAGHHNSLLSFTHCYGDGRAHAKKVPLRVSTFKGYDDDGPLVTGHHLGCIRVDG